ncbi:MAG: hypothetical protein WCB57_01810 [Pseudonocardiaceae bacterium]
MTIRLDSQVIDAERITAVREAARSAREPGATGAPAPARSTGCAAGTGLHDTDSHDATSRPVPAATKVTFGEWE